jgi:cell division protein FtsI (penicillin-binding protein 3)
MDKDVFKKMQIDYKLLEIKQKTKKILILLLLLSFGIFIVLFSIYRTIHEKRTLPTLTGEKSELAVRGNIISEDGFNLVSSKKIYKASVDTRYLNPDKKELFMILFSIYSGIDYKTLSEKFKEVEKNPGLLVLSYNIDSRAAKNLRELDIKLNQLNVFVPRKGGSLSLIRRLEVSESGEKRTFSYDDTLTPVLGYIKKIESQTGKTKVDGVKGLERSYDQKLNEAKDGILKGYRDVISYIYFDKNSIMEHRIDGYSLNLNIPLKLQKNNETTLDNHKIRTKADEILLTIMESRTGKIISMASSNRFNPENIKQSDIPYLNVNAIEYQFEPGSVVKPLSISLALDKGVVRKNEYFSAYNQTHAKGAYPFGRFTIKDDHAFPKGKPFY